MSITIGTDGWCTAAQVRTQRLAQLNARYAAGDGVITDTVIEGLITEGFARINAVARNVGYTVAGLAADSTALVWLKSLNLHLAAVDVAMAQSALVTQSAPPCVELWNSRAADMLRELRDGVVSFAAAQDTRESSTPLDESLLEGGDDEDAPVTINGWSSRY